MESSGETKQHLSRFNSTISYTPIEGLKLSSVLSYTKWNQGGGYAETKQHISTLRDGRNGYVSTDTRESLDKLAEITAEYFKAIGKHQFKVLAGYSYQERSFERLTMENWDFPTDMFDWHNIALGEAAKDGKITTRNSIRN
jgi:hypothetical protein